MTGRLALRVLVAAVALAAAGPAAAARSGAPLALPMPAFPPAAATAGVGSGGLHIESTRRNAITDSAAWIEANRLDLRQLDTGWPSDTPLPALPAWAPTSLGGDRLVRAIVSGAGRRLLLVYGSDAATCTVIAGHDARTGKRLWAFDLTSFGLSPQTPASERSFAFQQIVWAEVRDGVLYVETAHATYAASSGGRTAYLTAIATGSGKVLWRSPALVANAISFVLAGDAIVAGYGFTREPDFLTLLDTRTGALIGRVALRSGPDWIVAARGRLYVRTYDTDVVATLTRPAR